jgi:hypothetical protein
MNCGVFRCHLCSKTRATAQMMIWHLGWQHFKDKICKQHALTDKNLECPGKKQSPNEIFFYKFNNERAFMLLNFLLSLQEDSEAASTSNPPPGTDARQLERAHSQQIVQ